MEDVAPLFAQRGEVGADGAEGLGIFPKLTVEENLAMGAFSRNDAGVATDLKR